MKSLLLVGAICAGLACVFGCGDSSADSGDAVVVGQDRNGQTVELAVGTPLAVELAGTGVSTLSLWPGLVKNERMQALGLTEFQGFSLANAETPEFIGRVIAALAADPKIGERSGHTLITAETALDYGITDIEGNQPDSHRALFGGGPLY